ncbi:MAG: glycine-rich domain-containing protein [Streptomyces sp.]|uniref:glycine-rich domain-containing protein n=1 Tax=Streptomyces sp. TaxID=1931 RepID=UPI003D6B85A1
MNELISGSDMERVLVTITDNNPGMVRPMARRIIGEAAKFVAAGAQYDLPMAPSRVVDEGWHALILHTALYRDLCDRYGRFVDHHPGYAMTNYDPEVLRRTRATIDRAGFAVDVELWAAPNDGGISVAANCQHSGGPNGPITPIPRPKGID